jgi:hypothetical protein
LLEHDVGQGAEGSCEFVDIGVKTSNFQLEALCSDCGLDLDGAQEILAIRNLPLDHGLDEVVEVVPQRGEMLALGQIARQYGDLGHHFLS